MSEIKQGLNSRRIFTLALPIVASNVSVPLVGLVDTAVMGHLDAPGFIGAVALGATIFSLLFWAFGFLRLGVTGLVAQRSGAGDSVRIRELVLQSMSLALALGFCIVMIQWPIQLLALSALQASEDVEQLTAIYYSIRVVSAPAVFLMYVVLGTLIGLQRTGAAFVVQLILNMSNVLLDLLFVVYFDFGIEGVAWASVISEYGAIVVAIIIIKRALQPPTGIWPWGAILKLADYSKLLRINADILVRNLAVSAGSAWFTANSARHGDLVLAANAVLLQFSHFLAYALDGFAHAAEALVGHAIGARQPQALSKAMLLTTFWALMTAICASIFLFFAGPMLINLVTTQEEVRSFSKDYLPWLVAMPIVAVWSYQLDGIFIGAVQSGAMRNAMLISLAMYLLFDWWLGNYAPTMSADLATVNHNLWLAITGFMLFRALTLSAYLPRILRIRAQ